MGGLWSIVLFLLIASWDYMYVDQTVEEVEGEEVPEESSYFDPKTETVGESASWVEDEKRELLVKKRRRTSSGANSHSAERLRETNKSVNF